MDGSIATGPLPPFPPDEAGDGRSPTSPPAPPRPSWAPPVRPGPATPSPVPPEPLVPPLPRASNAAAERSLAGWAVAAIGEPAAEPGEPPAGRTGDLRSPGVPPPPGPGSDPWQLAAPAPGEAGGPAVSPWITDPGEVPAPPVALPARPGRKRRDRSTILGRFLDRVDPLIVGALLFLVAAWVYLGSNPGRIDFYDHFTWQAEAWLSGHAGIRWPVSEGPFVNDYFQDVLPLDDDPGHALIPFPPLPAILLLPFVAAFGLAASASTLAAVLGALNVVLCWRMLLRVTDRRDAALLGAIFYGFGTVAWYAAMLGNTWFYAHVAASTFVFLSITAALDADRREQTGQAARRIAGILVPRAVWAGFLAGIGMLARLPTGFGAIFLVFVGGGGHWFRRGLSAAIGALIPVLLLLGYNLTVTGHLFHPAYEYLYRNEYRPVGAFWNDSWAIEDPRYIPQNAIIMLAWPPERPIEEDPECAGRGNLQGADLLFDRQCPLLRPSPIGMSILLTSPAYLLMLPVLLRGRRNRLVLGAGLAVLLITIVNLSHFSQGWVQFGYRFSNDFAPYAAILVTLGIASALRNRTGTAIAVLLVGASVLVNAWGVWWGVARGW